MRPLIGTAIGLALLGATASSQQFEIMPNGSRPSVRGPAQYFSGAAVIDPLFAATDYTQAAAAHVTVEPGARTAWHAHPAGQTLIVTAGTGWVREWGGARRDIRPGDVIWIPPRVKHWHGGTATNGMSHIAIQERVDGEVVEWMERVSEEQYGGD